MHCSVVWNKVISCVSRNTCEKYNFVLIMRFLLIMVISSASYRSYTNDGFGSDAFLPNYSDGGVTDSDLNFFHRQQGEFYLNTVDILKNSSLTSFELNDGSRCSIDLRACKKAFDIRCQLHLKNKLFKKYKKRKNFTFAYASGEKYSIHNKKDGGGDYYVGYSSDPFGKYERYVENMIEGEIPTGPVYLSNDMDKPRVKRSVVNLYYMIKCATRCNPMSYLGYGCYCGLSGRGKPVDFIDRCCQIHDQCYTKTGCLYLKEYLMPYLWKCRKHQAECALSHDIFGGPGSCADRLCQCDRKFSECVKRRKCPTMKPKCSSSSLLEHQNKMKAMKEELIRKIEKDLKEEEKLKLFFAKEEADIKREKRKGFIQRLQLERREAGLDGVVLKAQEVAKVQENEMRQEERLAAELSLIRQKEIVDEKLRQQLRQNSHELKDLERQLKAAYGNKILAAQIAEHEAQKVQEQMIEQKTRELLLKALGSEEEREKTEMMHEKEMKEKYRYSLQNQIIEKERLRQEEYLAYLKERKVVEDTIKNIKKEEERENFEKLIIKEKVKQEMEQFYAARELWKAKERILIDKENQKLESTARMKEEIENKRKEKHSYKKERDERIQQIVNQINVQKQLKEERKELMGLLREYEKEERERSIARKQLENMLIANREAQHEFQQILAEKNRKAIEEKQLDARFAQQMNLKTQEEERNEKEKEDRRRLNRINDRIYNQNKIKNNIEKRAESLKLAQLAVEIEEKEEKKRIEMIEEERIRILKEHAPNLIGYFPKGCLKEKDLEILGLTSNSALTEAGLSMTEN